MAENPNNRLQKFNGSKSAIRPESWIKLYDFENNSLKEDEKIKNLMYYLTDSALEWYADEIISNPAIKRWEVVKEKLIQRFGSYNANPIVSASHRRLKREESIENYFQDKIRLLNQTHLTKEEKIHLLADGLPNDWKDLIVAARPTDATKWFHIAASIEQNRASIQFKPKNKIHLATKNSDNRKNVCPFWCPICSKKGIKIKHWVTDCEDYDPNYKKDRPNQNTSVKQECGAPELLNVSTLTNTPTQGAFKLINISVEVNGIPAQAFVDTGATVSIINWRLFKRTRLQLQPNSDIHISQADGVTRTCGSLQTKHAIDLGKVAIQHKIITKSEQPISLRPYRRPLKEYEEIAEQVKELLEHKLIRISDSPWAFPVVMVPKKDGNKRMCIDYRRLNEITLDDRQPLPHIQDMFDRLHVSRFFSTLDVAWGYWQIEMDPQSIQKTAFVTSDGHYEFLVMPFGLKNAASTFQRIIQHILGELLWKGTCSFQDDILVYTKTWQEHIELLSKVFDKLRLYNMKLKLSKCIFGRTEVKYLGHIISHNQLKPDPGKVKSIQDFPRPDTVKKVRQFMGLANYYRKFVKDFSKISFPLVRLTRKNQPFIWNEEVEESFAKLKMALSTKPVLAIYNPDYPSKVYTDASKYGIGAILTQIGPDNEEHVIAYYSKTLQPDQENYSAYEMECLAVIQATDHFHVYIENQPFEIITDHAALQWLFTMKKPKPKYFRWILSLSSKSCNIVHRFGKQQTHVDALSRLPVVNIATQELQEHQQNSDLSFLKNSHTHDGVVMIKQKGVFKAVVPNSLTKKILEEYHDSLSHPSITKTCKLITQCYWWKGITTDIKNYVRSCKSCQLVKVRHEPTLGEMITPTSNIQPLQMIGCDTIVLGTAAANTKHKFIQVFVDHATRYLWAYPTITNTSQAVTQCLDKIIKSVNSINTILTDNGKNFISKEFNKFLSLQGIKHTYTSPYHPQCNGICEKLNDTIMTKLRIAVLEKPRCKWSTLLPQVFKNYNSTPHDVTGFSPLFLMYGIGNVPEFADQTPITIEEARKKASLRTEQIRSKWKIKHDSHHPKYVFKEGDLVIRKIAFNDPRLIKTSPKYEGPFVIQKKISDVTYDISLKDQKQARRRWTRESQDVLHRSVCPEYPGSSLIVRLVDQRSLLPDRSGDWTLANQTTERQVQVHYAFRAQCDSQFTGDQCMERCPGPEDTDAHFDCGEDGRKVCRAGWTGPQCDQCRPSTGCHPEHGYCETPGECRCRLGWTGPTCEQCLPLPGCQHGACNRSFECTCDDGWGGFFCGQPLCKDKCHPTRGFCEAPGECRPSPSWKVAIMATMEVLRQSQLSLTTQQPITFKHDQLIANHQRARGRISTNEKSRELMTMISDKKKKEGLFSIPSRVCSFFPCEKPPFDQDCAINHQSNQFTQPHNSPGFNTILHPNSTGLLQKVNIVNSTAILQGTHQSDTICHSECHPISGYCKKPKECRCRVGWQGPRCDQCHPYPGCVHGNCTEPWECNCQPGWGGTLCDTKLDYCEANSPCPQGSTCIPGDHKDVPYQCICPDGVSDPNCTHL
ncbi:K02A2.6-like [Cordylochernes scorpioides]|uniref:Delta-like protein n=1 Tax=Cordylochernes scorpioides TaxID=51811 RepID=A0ABY6L3I6_9ARAC|nr:K02A2.6-like [Cordylochernes scorpioides]